MQSKHISFVAAVLLSLAMMSVVLAACARPGTTSASASNGSSGNSSGGSSSSSSSGGATVHMNSSNFEQSSVTISKGSSLTLVDDAAVIHIIQNGSWENGNAKPATEPGAPKVNLQFSGNDTHSIGPFNTAGTFHLYCTVHPGMNLTVIVK
jgi:plastocyanin